MPRVPQIESRVQAAPTADATSRVRADNSGAAVGQALQGFGAAGVQAANRGQAVMDQRAEEDSLRPAMERTNAYLEESGRADQAFRALQGNLATPEARDNYLKAIDQAHLKNREGLDEKAALRYDQVALRDRMAKRLDAEAHFTAQSKIAAEQARVTNLKTSANEAVGKAGTAQGDEAIQRVFAAIALDPSIQTPEARQLAEAKAVSAITTDAVEVALRQGDLARAEAAHAKAKKSGLLDADSDSLIGEKLRRHTEVRRNAEYVKGVVGIASEKIKGDRPEHFDAQEDFARQQVQKAVEAGTVTPEEAERRVRGVEAAFADRRRSQVVKDNAAEKYWGERLDGSGGLTASRAVIEAMGPEHDWLKPALLQRALRQYGDEAGNAAPTLKDPKAIAKYEATIVNGIKNGVYTNPQALTAAADMVKLPTASHTRLQAMLKSGDLSDKGISQEAVMNAAKAVMGDSKLYKDDPAAAFQLYKDVVDTWGGDEKPDPIKLNEHVKALMWKGALERGKGDEMSYLDALRSGRESEWRANLDESQLELVRQAMRDEGIDPDPKTPVTWRTVTETVPVPRKDRTTASIGGVFGVKPSYTGPGAAQPTTRTRTVTEGGAPVEEDPADMERAYFMRRNLKFQPDVSLANVREAKRLAAEAEVAGMTAEAAGRLTAEAGLANAVAQASFGDPGQGIRGADAAYRQLEASLAAGELPAWANDYLKLTGEGAELKGAKSKDEWRQNARRVLLRAIGTVTRRDQ